MNALVSVFDAVFDQIFDQIGRHAQFVIEVDDRPGLGLRQCLAELLLCYMEDLPELTAVCLTSLCGS